MIGAQSSPSEGSNMHAYGALATRLNQALARSRDALESHAGLLPRGRLSELDALLAEFARRRVRIAIYGEVKAGKSTLINAIAGAQLSPVAFDPLTSIPVRITYGSQTSWRVGERVVGSLGELEAIMRERPGGAEEVVVETDLDLLQLGGQVDLLDTPGVGSEQRFDAISAEVLRSLDAVVLVVRYPGLFTRLTRDLVHGLEADIAKLFVVWNLDAACAELSQEERNRHAENLRANVAGAHELFLVDARRAVNAASSGNGAAAETGIADLVQGLARFASSDKRQVAALREAAKRADRWLEDAQRALTERKSFLEAKVMGAHARIEAVESAAEAKRGTARAQFSEFQTALRRAGERYTAATAEIVGDFRRQLRRARRRWIWGGDFSALESQIGQAVRDYADRVEAESQATRQALQEAAQRFGTVIPTQPRARIEPKSGDLALAEGRERAVSGRLPLLRRALYANRYLPGLATLERAGVEDDLTSQLAWFESTSRASEEAARAMLESRLADIARRAEQEIESIKTETALVSAEEELQRLTAHLPVIIAQRTEAAKISAEARALAE